MKQLLYVLLLVSFVSKAYSQEKHFIFIQSENRQPFYVSLNEKIYSSSASGYIIIPKLHDSTYNFAIGFAQNAYPEQVFNYTINNKNAGFSLKNFGEKGWGLFNLQSLSVIMAGEVKKVSFEKSNKEKEVSDEPLISFDKKPVAVTKLPGINLTEKDSIKDAMVADTSLNTQKAIIEQKDSKKVDADTRAKGKVIINKVAEDIASDKVSMTYIDGEGKKADTIQVVIPSSNPKVETSPVKESLLVSNEAKSDTSKIADDKREKLLAVDSVGVPAVNISIEPVSSNSNCKNQASEDDYTKLRRKMARETTDEKMMSEAGKFFQRRCFSTSQIKALSTLFLSDEGRYNFFETSYKYVTDPDQYQILSSEFIDPAFARRFKAFLNK